MEPSTDYVGAKFKNPTQVPSRMNREWKRVVGPSVDAPRTMVMALLTVDLLRRGSADDLRHVLQRLPDEDRHGVEQV